MALPPSRSDGRAMIDRRRYLHPVAPAVLLAAGVGRLSAHETSPVRFVLDWKFEGEHAQFTVPITDGTFRRLGLDVKLERGNGSCDTVAKVAAGAYDMGLADTYTMMRFNASNPGNKLVSVA